VGTSERDRGGLASLTNLDGNAPVSIRSAALRRTLTWVLVVLVHASLITSVLLAPRALFRERRSLVESPSLILLPQDSARIGTPRVSIQVVSGNSHPKFDAKLALPPIDNAITLLPGNESQPRIDWDLELARSVKSSLAQADKEMNYRDLSNLTPEQLDWVKRNHMVAMPEFQWDRNSRSEALRHGMIKINDYCVLIVVIPFCKFGGKIQYNGDLFKHMRDPTPLDP
jgi:hypothetical protein